MNFSELETVRAQWKLDVPQIAELLGMADGEQTYNSLQGQEIPEAIANHVETLKMLRSINRGVFNNYLTKVYH